MIGRVVAMLARWPRITPTEARILYALEPTLDGGTMAWTPAAAIFARVWPGLRFEAHDSSGSHMLQQNVYRIRRKLSDSGWTIETHVGWSEYRLVAAEA